MQASHTPARTQSSVEEDPRTCPVPVAAQEPTAGRVLPDATQEERQQQPPAPVSGETPADTSTPAALEASHRPATPERRSPVPVAAQEPTAGRGLSDATQGKDQQQPPVPAGEKKKKKKKKKRTTVMEVLLPEKSISIDDTNATLSVIMQKKVSNELRIPNTYELADKRKGKRALEAAKDSQPAAKKLKVPAEEAQIPQAPKEAAEEAQKPLPQAPKMAADQAQKPLPQAPKEAAGQERKPLPKMPKVNFLTYDRETQRKVQNYLRKYRRKHTVPETPLPSN